MLRRVLLLLAPVLAAVAGCMTPPKDLDLALTRPSEQGRFVVALHPLVQPLPLHRLHAWEVAVTTAAGAPVSNARIGVDGGMPQHGHGLPTQPRVTKELGGGRYLVEGMEFSMTGWWEIKLDVHAADGTSDKVTFNQLVEAPRAAASAQWSAEERTQLAALRWSQRPAAVRDPSNAFEDSPAAADLGRRLFVDTRFSRNGQVSCASCHDPSRGFQDGRPLGQGIATGARRTMPIAGAGRGPWLFWDGRKDSLWSQALGPMEDGAEHGGNRLRFAHLVDQHYRADYRAVFGDLPALAGLPANAGPLGTAEERRDWEAMDPAARERVSRVFANMGKAIAAYEKTLDAGPSRVDRYIEAVVAGRAEAVPSLDERELRGLKLFIGKAQCATCHDGPMLNDGHFHNTGVPARPGLAPDRGRAAALAKLLGDEFNCLGRFSDARPEQCGELRFLALDDPRMEGAFRTPGLRDVAARAPYMHAGQMATLEDVVQHYVRAPIAAVGRSERRPLALSASEQQDLVALLRALDSLPQTAPLRRSPSISSVE